MNFESPFVTSLSGVEYSRYFKRYDVRLSIWSYGNATAKLLNFFTTDDSAIEDIVLFCVVSC